MQWHTMPGIEGIVDTTVQRRDVVSARRAVLVAVSGIDGGGKSYLARGIVEALRARGVRAAGLGVDGWLNLPSRRFSATDPAEHYYQHALRFDDMFAQLVWPLRDRRSLRVEVDHVEETASLYHRHTYDFTAIDVIVLEGIYLLKRSFQARYDLSVWIDCTFETALARAVARGQEGLPPAATIDAYRTIYFPAQQIHFERDAPRDAATAIVTNDPRLDSVAAGFAR
jgi:uridine kinase